MENTIIILNGTPKSEISKGVPFFNLIQIRK